MTSITKGVEKIMSKKIFVFALLAVFVLAQFSIASATPIAGATVTLEPLPAFNRANGHPYNLIWSVTDLPSAANQYMNFWYRVQNAPADPWICVGNTDVSNLANANGTFTSNFGGSDQEVLEFLATVDDIGCPAAPSNSTPAMTSTFLDGRSPWVLDYQAPNPAGWGDDVACNTFELYALASDSAPVNPGEGFSGFDSWNPETTGTFAPPAPEGPAGAELSWVVTLPSTASGNWTLRLRPTDIAGNYAKVAFWSNEPIVPSELEECANFSDVAGHANEVYIRYLADLGLIAGFADGTFGPDNTLTRAEAATLFEKANGWEDETGLPDSAPTGCEFTDVSASDWFAGWVWQACADGFMNGIGGGLFDPNNLLTRGQVVTIFNNIHDMNGGTGGYLDFSAGVTTLEYLGNVTDEYRAAAWTDLYVGDYYTLPAIYAYGVGIADGTSATTFSPNQAATRGEFAKMLYRALGESDL
jgi:hypothetical protein